MKQLSLEEEIKQEKLAEFHSDPVKCARQIFPDWFPKPMPWFHRGILAIRLRRADFLLNFGEEQWKDGSRNWTKKDLAKLVRCFKSPIDPSNPQSDLEPIFRITFAEDGRTPISIQMKLGQHVALILPRGFSKTTLMNFAELYDILYLNTKLDLYISDTRPQALRQNDTLRRELETNEQLRARS